MIMLLLMLDFLEGRALLSWHISFLRLRNILILPLSSFHRDLPSAPLLVPSWLNL
jgi:hypothetical protein